MRNYSRNAFTCFTLLALAAPAFGATETADAVAELQEWLAKPADERPAIEEQDFAAAPLTADEAKQAAAMLWRDHAERVATERKDEVEAKVVRLDGKEMKYDFRTFGDKPEGGHALYISMHGGGNAPARVNDRQWQNQIGLYQVEEGIYLSPRAPTNTWNLWHEAHIDGLFDRLIDTLVSRGEVDPNHVYIMGYSAGGDGVYQLAPRMADRLAAAAMMAGHPNETQPEGLRNLPFALQVGGEDGAYDRNKIATNWGKKLQELHEQDPGGYENYVKIHEGMGHWMQLKDAAALPWMAGFERRTRPEKIVWLQDDVKHGQFYWLAVDKDAVNAGATIVAKREGNKITIEESDPDELAILLDDNVANLDEPVEIVYAPEGESPKTLFSGKVERSIGELAKSLAERPDPEMMFSGRQAVTIR